MSDSDFKNIDRLNDSHAYRLMLFDLSIYGHHPGYIRYLLDYWHQEKLSGEVIVLVSPRFLIEHSDVVKHGESLNSENIRFIAITSKEEGRLKKRNSGINRNIRNFQEWLILCRYAAQLKINHVLVMYYDTYQYPLALRLNPPCKLSGIYFRPTFHYDSFSSSWIENRGNLAIEWEKFVLHQVLENPAIHRLLSLDPFAVEKVEKQVCKNKLTYLPDPVRIQHYSTDRLAKINQSMGFESHRTIFLLFGALTERKGIYKLLSALDRLADQECEQVAIALVGEASSDHQPQIESQINALCAKKNIQIYRNYQFVPDDDVQAYFQIADVVLAPYQRHVGMSGILILAAAKQKPVLSSNYGLMGQMVEKYGLGVAVDSTNPEELAAQMRNFLSSKNLVCDLVNMKKFAAQNDADEFARIIFSTLYESVDTANSS